MLLINTFGWFIFTAGSFSTISSLPCHRNKRKRGRAEEPAAGFQHSAHAALPNVWPQNPRTFPAGGRGPAPCPAQDSPGAPPRAWQHCPNAPCALFLYSKAVKHEAGGTWGCHCAGKGTPLGTQQPTGSSTRGCTLAMLEWPWMLPGRWRHAGILLERLWAARKQTVPRCAPERDSSSTVRARICLGRLEKPKQQKNPQAWQLYRDWKARRRRYRKLWTLFYQSRAVSRQLYA